MTAQIHPNSGALLLRQIGEVLFGASWHAELSNQISVSDRSMRRWASGEDEIPSGVWRDIHYYAQSQWLTIKYFDEEIAKLLDASALQSIPNTAPEFDSWGIYFNLRTRAGRPIRCFIRREVFDDRVSSNPAIKVINYFQEYADVFYRVAQRKFDDGEIDGNLLSIGNADVEGEGLPDVRNR
jgi:hypothetical protein